MQAILYLIPTTLGSNWNNIPNNVKNIAASIDTFIVENIRTARRHLRKMGNTKSFDNEVDFLVLDKHHFDATKIYNFLIKCKDLNKPIGMLSEAGNPCIADPGSQIVDMAYSLTYKVKPLVGPSSILLALIGSGLNGQEFTFNGYLPIEKNKRAKAVKKLESIVLSSGFTQIFMETPYRNIAMFECLKSVLKETTKLCVACNLGEKDEYIETKSIKNWGKVPNIHKKPSVFVIGK